jgi:alanine dehydrogenase
MSALIKGDASKLPRLQPTKTLYLPSIGVTHFCVPNIASRVARTATTALSNIFTPILVEMSEVGGLDELIFSQKWFIRGVYFYKGTLTNAMISRKIGLKYTDLNLLMAARF